MKVKKFLLGLLVGIIGFSALGNISTVNAATEIIINDQDGGSISYDDLPQEIKDLISNATSNTDTTSKPQTNKSTKATNLISDLEKIYVKKVTKTTNDKANWC